VFNVEMNVSGTRLLQQHHASSEHCGKNHSHRSSRLHPAHHTDRLDEKNGDHCCDCGANHHGNGGDLPRNKKGCDDARQGDVADRVPDHALPTQDEEVPKERARYA
jgi:hypothetical protein